MGPEGWQTACQIAIAVGSIVAILGGYGSWHFGKQINIDKKISPTSESQLKQEYSGRGDNVGGNKYETNNFYGSSGSQRPPETRTVPLNYPTKSGLQAELLDQGYKIHGSRTEIQKIENISPPIPTPLSSSPIEREFTKRTPRELLSFYSSDRTQLEANRLIQSYIGQWIEIQEKVVDVGHGAPDGDQTAVILKSGNDQIECRFSRKWKKKLDRLAKGESIKLVGKIGATQNGHQLYLVECEVL